MIRLGLGALGSPPIVYDGDPKNQNLSPVDIWTAIHVLTGAAGAVIGMDPRNYVLLAIWYELAEQLIERSPNNIFKSARAESPQNAVVDVVAGIAGFYAARRLLGVRVEE